MEPIWNTSKASRWLKITGHIPIKRVHRNGHELRYRMTDPDQYKYFRTKKLSDGIYFVLGFK